MRLTGGGCGPLAIATSIRVCEARGMRRSGICVLAVALAARHARADDAPSQPASPWIDLAPTNVLTTIATDPGPAEHHPVAAVATLAGFYAAFSTFGFIAWYRLHKPASQYKFGGDGWLGLDTYAAGADKMGHAWSTMAVARMGTELLADWGGYDRRRSIYVSTAMSEALFLAVEVSDGFYYEFSFSDLAGDTAGALLALAFQLSPRFDEMFDFRVQYWPSPEYLHDLSTPGSPNRLNIDDDYNGQTYLFAYHLGSIHSLRDTRYGTLARFVDVGLGFETRGYKPTPAGGVLPASEHHQNLFIGVSLNAQGVFDYLLGNGRHERGRKLLHGAFEVFNVPAASFAVPGLEWSRTPAAPPTNME
jgi:hypothetical protein